MSTKLYGSAPSNEAQMVYVVNQLGSSLYIDDTVARTGTFTAITALAAAVATVVNNGTTLTSIPIPAGTTIYGNFTSITLASGKVLAYG